MRTEERARWQRYAACAEAHCLCARQARGHGYVRSRVLDEIRLAKVRLAQREPEEAAAVGAHAMRLAAETRSSLVVNWLTGLGRDMTARYPALGDMERFHEQLRDYLRQAAPARADGPP